MRTFLLATLLAFLQTQPSTRPAPPPLTPEEQRKLTAYVSVPTTQPHVKMVWNPYRPDGSRHPDYGKPESNFMRLHAEYLERSTQPADVLFMGDSVTEAWRNQGKKVFADNYGKYNAAAFGTSGARTEHLLWRIADGELDAFAAHPPKVVVLLIGVNNGNRTPEDVAAGTTACVNAIHAKLPTSKILLLSIFPVREKPDHPDRIKFAKANEILKTLDGSLDGKVKYFELYNQFLSEDGTISKTIMSDFVHPTAKGYQLWADAMNPVLEDMLK